MSYGGGAASESLDPALIHRRTSLLEHYGSYWLKKEGR